MNKQSPHICPKCFNLLTRRDFTTGDKLYCNHCDFNIDEINMITLEKQCGLNTLNSFNY